MKREFISCWTVATGQVEREGGRDFVESTADFARALAALRAGTRRLAPRAPHARVQRRGRVFRQQQRLRYGGGRRLAHARHALLAPRHPLRRPAFLARGRLLAAACAAASAEEAGAHDERAARGERGGGRRRGHGDRVHQDCQHLGRVRVRKPAPGRDAKGRWSDNTLDTRSPRSGFFTPFGSNQKRVSELEADAGAVKSV